jgi:hypothetical protein
MSFEVVADGVAALAETATGDDDGEEEAVILG